MRRVFIIVPSLHPTGPVKGAVALANAIAAHREVTLVAVKPGPGADAPLDAAVKLVELDAAGVRSRIRAVRGLVAGAGGRAEVATISFCFSADLVNVFLRRLASTVASVRGNLPQNYRLDYGWRGVPFAMLHLAMLRGVGTAVAMTDSMAAQMRPFVGYAPPIVPNFVDEAHLEVFRKPAPAQGPLRFVFLGSLSRRKQPHLLLHALRSLLDAGHDVEADLVGSGPLEREVRDLVANLSLGGRVRLQGQLAVPYHIVAEADALVLPSLSEGVPRAGLEALFLGVPCVLREADGNGELIQPGSNGVLFRDDKVLAESMLAAAHLSRSRQGRDPLLPPAFRQAHAAARYLALADAGMSRAVQTRPEPAGGAQ